MSLAPHLADGQRCQVLIGGPTYAHPTLLFETDELRIEAPNWSLDGRNLYLNGGGLLWALDVANPEAGLRPIMFDGLPELNNDHVLDPDGEHIFLSANDGHIYRAALNGGAVEQMTPNDGMRHFLHGVSPDGKRLAYVELKEFGDHGKLAVLPTSGGEVSRLDTGYGHIDGPEWSPDGQWIYFNTEGFTNTPGHAQLARIHESSGTIQRLVTSETVDWFPHLSADNRAAAYISYPAGTLGHPGDLDVEVVVVSPGDWSSPIQRYPVFGGQGTINVHSWSPDGTRFAFVAYPIA
ncbi:biopolymer transporter Tol [Arthrobacter sp. R1-13]